MLAKGDTRKECCRYDENLGPVIQERTDLRYRRCSVCGCRHFELSLDPAPVLTPAEVAKVLAARAQS